MKTSTIAVSHQRRVSAGPIFPGGDCHIYGTDVDSNILFRQDSRFADGDKGWVAPIGADHNQHANLILRYRTLRDSPSARVDIHVGAYRQICPDGTFAVRATSLRSGDRRWKIGEIVVIRCAGNSDRSNPADGYRSLGDALVIHKLE